MDDQLMYIWAEIVWSSTILYYLHVLLEDFTLVQRNLPPLQFSITNWTV
jgi:hypothetical protein